MGALSGSSFVGEKFIQVKLPDYEEEYRQLTALLWVAGFLLVLFLLIPRKLISVESFQITTTTVRIPKKPSEKEEQTVNVKNVSIRKTPSYSRWISIIGFIVTIWGVYKIVISSPYNRYLLRRAFVVPIFTGDECSHIISIAENVAIRNIEKAEDTLEEYEKYYKEYAEDEDYKESIQLLQDPKGWQKLRHGTYPTTDLSVENDPFTSGERSWIINLLDRRLAAMLSRLYGVPPTAMRAYDLFIVQYGSNHQAALERHMDGGDIGVAVLLNNDFEGGGTRYWDRRTNQPFEHVKTKKVGNLITHPALIDHEGFPITAGKRYILVAQLDIDRTLNAAGDGKHTGISPFASYLNMNWVYRRIANYHSEHMDWIRQNCSKKTRDFMFKILKKALSFGDEVDHKVEFLVHDEDAASFIRAIDESYDAMTPKPRWV